MRVLILGGSGMLGHKLGQTFSSRFDTYVSLRGQAATYGRFRIVDESRALSGLSAENVDGVARALRVLRPEVVVNCIGIVKQDAEARDPIVSITVNALFPHRLAQACREVEARLIHLS